MRGAKAKRVRGLERELDHLREQDGDLDARASLVAEIARLKQKGAPIYAGALETKG